MPTYIYDKGEGKMVELKRKHGRAFGIGQREPTTEESQAADVRKGFSRMEDSGRWTSKYSKNQVRKIWGF